MINPFIIVAARTIGTVLISSDGSVKATMTASIVVIPTQKSFLLKNGRESGFIVMEVYHIWSNLFLLRFQ